MDDLLARPQMSGARRLEEWILASVTDASPHFMVPYNTKLLDDIRPK